MYSFCSFTGTPTGVTAKRISYNSVNVSWMAPLKGPSVASYEVFYQLIGGTKNVSGGNTSNTELTLTGLTLGNYSFFVLGAGAKGKPVLQSDPSNIATVVIGKSIIINVIMISYPIMHYYHFTICRHSSTSISHNY